MIQIILKGLWHRRVQNIALLIVIAVGVCLTFAVVLIQNGVSVGLEQAKQRLGADILVVPAGASVSPGEILYGGSPSNMYMPQNIEQQITQFKGVNRVTAQFFTQTLSEDCCDVGEAIRLIGYDPQTDWLIQPWLKNISKVELANDEVIIGTNVTAFSGNEMNILGKKFHIAAIMEPTGTGLDHSILMNLSIARKIAAQSPVLQGFWQNNGDPSGLISAVLIETKPDANIDVIMSALVRTFNVQAFSAIETKRHIYEQLFVITSLLTIAGIMAVVASMIQMFSRLYALTVERQSEWGLYLALGSTPKTIALLLIAEGGILCALGVLVGLVLGYLLYLWSIAFLATYQSFPFIAPGWLIIAKFAGVIFLVWLLLGILAALIPAYRSSRIEPSLVMTRGEFD